MKSKNILFIILCIIMSIILILLILSRFENKRTYELKLPEFDNLKYISLEQNAARKTINDNTEMESIFNVIVGLKRITRKESIQDVPVNVNDKITINFTLLDGTSSTIFVYKKDRNYYIEQPYNGIYIMSEYEYNFIENVLK